MAVFYVKAFVFNLNYLFKTSIQSYMTEVATNFYYSYSLRNQKFDIRTPLAQRHATETLKQMLSHNVHYVRTQ